MKRKWPKWVDVALGGRGRREGGKPLTPPAKNVGRYLATLRGGRCGKRPMPSFWMSEHGGVWDGHGCGMHQEGEDAAPCEADCIGDDDDWFFDRVEGGVGHLACADGLDEASVTPCGVLAADMVFDGDERSDDGDSGSAPDDSCDAHDGVDAHVALWNAAGG